MYLKLIKRIVSSVLTLIMAACMMNTAVLANEVKVTEKTGSGSIIVTVYNNDPGTDGTGAQTDVTDGDPVDGVGINALRIGNVVELTSTDSSGNVSTQVAFGLEASVSTALRLNVGSPIATKDGINYYVPAAVQEALKAVDSSVIESYLSTAKDVTTKVTGQNSNQKGVAVFDGLKSGLYLLAKSELPSDATTDLVPFLVSLPMYVEAEGTTGNWQSIVYAYPKVRTADITVTKTVNDRDTQTYESGDIYVNAGQTLTYTVTATIPASNADDGTGSSTEFTSFIINDTNTGGTLNIDNSSLTVILNNGENTDNVITLVKDTDYTVSYPDNDSDRILTINFTETGLIKLNQNLVNAQTVTVSYNAVLKTDGGFSTELSNQASLTYTREGMASAQGASAANTGNTINSNEVNLYTYGIDLTKTLSDNNDNVAENEISFKLYKTSDNGTLSDQIFFEKKDTGYWQTATRNETAMSVNTDGQLYLYGLEPGEYYLKEITTKAGYTLLDEPITIVISDENTDGVADAKVNGVTAQVSDGVVSLTVVNTKNSTGFTLPKTGGAGTLMVTAVGLGLLSAAVVLLLIYRRKEQGNS